MGNFVKELDKSDEKLIKLIPREVENLALEMLEDLRKVTQNLI